MTIAIVQPLTQKNVIARTDCTGTRIPTILDNLLLFAHSTRASFLNAIVRYTCLICTYQKHFRVLCTVPVGNNSAFVAVPIVHCNTLTKAYIKDIQFAATVRLDKHTANMSNSIVLLLLTTTIVAHTSMAATFDLLTVPCYPGYVSSMETWVEDDGQEISVRASNDSFRLPRDDETISWRRIAV